ncbi:MAG: peroxide stress protein YaaA [Clostridium sp.]
MMIVISPAKTLDMEKINHGFEVTKPRYLNKSEEVMNVLKEYQPNDLGTLMKLSTKLSELNFIRNGAWTMDNHENEKPCIFSFKGDVYKGIDIEDYSEDDIYYANDHLRILSGLYGLLRPLDGIHEYRLEMGTKLKVNDNKNLYEFWGKNFLREELLNDTKSLPIINLASEEYSKVLNLGELEEGKIITPLFKEFKNGEYKVIGIYAKKARGLMTSYIIKNRVETLEDLKKFDLEGYSFNEQLSNNKEFIFTRI